MACTCSEPYAWDCDTCKKIKKWADACVSSGLSAEEILADPLEKKEW